MAGRQECDIFTKYSAENQIGKGKYANVKKIKNLTNNEYFALKTTLLNINSPKEMEAAKNEYKILETLSHNNIVKFVEFFEDVEYIHGVFELCEHDLESLIDDCDRNEAFLKLEYVDSFAKDIANGLVYLYDQNIIHRDIKPANVLITGDNKAKICDFNLSQKLEVGEKCSGCYGTLLYMAPEILEYVDSEYGFEVDVWSFGILIYEMLSNKVPYEPEPCQEEYNIGEENSREMFNRECEEMVEKMKNGFTRLDYQPNLEMKERNLYEMLNDAVVKCLIYDPYKRSSIKDIAKFLNS